jgi:hypothetical protein
MDNTLLAVLLLLAVVFLSMLIYAFRCKCGEMRLCGCRMNQCRRRFLN